MNERQYFTEQASSYQEAAYLIRQKYGDRACITMQRTIPTGGFLGLFRREVVEVVGYVTNTERPPFSKEARDFENNRQEILQKNNSRMNGTHAPSKSHPSRRTEPQTPENDDIKAIFEKLKQIHEKQDSNTGTRLHPSLEHLQKLLRTNDFTDDFIVELIEKSRNHFSLEQLENLSLVEQQVAQWIGEIITIGTMNNVPRRKPCIIALVGPTGVGKTTTIAKMAKLLGIDERGRHIAKTRFITIDNYRIGAKEQLATYGRIMNIPVDVVSTAAEMKKTLALCADTDWVLIDTAGRSPRDSRQLGDMNGLLAACGSQLCSLLVVSATTKTGDILNIMRQYEQFDYRAMILSKLDETIMLGNVISALHKRPKPLLYFTTGQGVPDTIELAHVENMLVRLDGFRLDRDNLDAQKKLSREIL